MNLDLLSAGINLFLLSYSCWVVDGDAVRSLSLFDDEPRKVKKLKALFKDNVYTAKDEKNKKIQVMSQRTEDIGKEEVTVEAEIVLGANSEIRCNFGIVAKKGGTGDRQISKPTKKGGRGDQISKPTGWMECIGKLQDGTLEDLESMREEMFDNARELCGKRYKQCPPNFARGMAEYLMLYIRKKGKLPKKWRRKIDVSNVMPADRIHDGEEEEEGRRALRGARRGLHHTCYPENNSNSEFDIRNSKYPNSNDVNCPQYGSTAERNQGATCMCPYSGGGYKWAYYDRRDGQRFKWLRKYGRDSAECAGRCGATCNSADKEAFIDCFDHDSCVDHFGGSVFGDSADCGDEFDHAADDYIVSYGYCCCTCNFWIGCFC